MDIETVDLCKIYPLKTALNNANIKFVAKKIHALLGENGAGKSTLAAILSGNLKATSGKVLIDGKEKYFENPSAAIKNGIVIVKQSPLLAEEISGEQNIEISCNKKNICKSKDFIALKKTWAPLLKLKPLVKNIGGNERFYISLLQALIKKHEVLILDEPSAFLDLQEREKLYKNLRAEADKGGNIIVITHSKSEAANYCDDVTFLKKSDSPISLQSDEDYPLTKKDSTFLGKNFLCVENLVCRSKTKPALLNLSFKADYGAICAICGLNEPSMVTLEDIITGMDNFNARGKITICAREKEEEFFLGTRKGNRWSASMLRKYGTALVPSDRVYRASNPNLTVEQMITALPVTEKPDTIIKKAGVNIRADEKCSSLSGGMLQRLILERELSLNPSAIILCNPLQALDIDGQGRLCKRIKGLAEEGKAILIIGAAEFPLTLCSRVYNLEGGICSLSSEKKL